jgi:hypothetical protein
MSIITLVNPTHRPTIDRILQGVIGVFEQAFPERVRGYYLRGSHRNGSSVPNSDLDLYVIFKEDFRDPMEMQKAVKLCESCALISPMLLEIAPGGEVHLGRVELSGLTLNFKRSTQFLYGEDIRDKITAPSSETWIRWAMHSPLSSFIEERPHLDVLVFPLDYPAPEAEFYGYDRQTLPCSDSGEQPSTKWLVATNCWLATALVALRTGRYVGSKREAVEMYKAEIGDEWTDFIEQAYDCRGQWHYLIPIEKVDRQALRHLCQRALGFGNHFLDIYQDFLLRELHHDQSEAQLPALRSLKRIVYPQNQEITDAVNRLQQSSDEKIREAAIAAINRIYEVSESKAR